MAVVKANMTVVLLAASKEARTVEMMVGRMEMTKDLKLVEWKVLQSVAWWVVAKVDWSGEWG